MKMAMKKDCRKLNIRKCQAFAMELTALKVKAGAVGLFETMQVMDLAVQKVGFEIAQNIRQVKMPVGAIAKNPNVNRVLLIDCDYDEGKQGTYRGFLLKTKTALVWMFNTGNPLKDWADMVSYLVRNPPAHTVMSSSVNHFVMDGKKYAFDDKDNLILAPIKSKRKKI